MEDNNDYVVFLENLVIGSDKQIEELQLEIKILQDIIIEQYMIMHSIKS